MFIMEYWILDMKHLSFLTGGMYAGILIIILYNEDISIFV